MLSIPKFHNSTLVCYYSPYRRTIVFNGSKDRYLDNSRTDDRGLDSSANPGLFPGVASDAPSASGVALRKIVESIPRRWIVSGGLKITQTQH